jgi:hypothetical protein
MKVYRPKSNWMDEGRLHVPTIDVFERERGWKRTGLLDQHGNDLMSSDSVEQIGFVVFGESQ